MARTYFARSGYKMISIFTHTCVRVHDRVDPSVLRGDQFLRGDDGSVCMCACISGSIFISRFDAQP